MKKLDEEAESDPEDGKSEKKDDRVAKSEEHAKRLMKTIESGDVANRVHALVAESIASGNVEKVILKSSVHNVSIEKIWKFVHYVVPAIRKGVIIEDNHSEVDEFDQVVADIRIQLIGNGAKEPTDLTKLVEDQK